MAFPTSIPSYQGFNPNDTLQTDNHAVQHNQEQADIIALANKIGLGSSTASNGTILVGNGTGTSTWGQVPLATGVNGVLPTGNGGTGTSSTTGTGSVVFNTSPNLTNPTETGGTYNSATLNAPNITYSNNSIPAVAIVNNAITSNQIANGGITFVNLLSTLFSGQQQTYTNSGNGGGTGYYVNICGIKLCYGISGSFSASSGTNYTVSLPASFFSSVQWDLLYLSGPSNGSLAQAINANPPTTSTLTIFIGGSAGITTSLGWIAVGT